MRHYVATIVSFITKYRNGLLAVIPILIGTNWATGTVNESVVNAVALVIGSFIAANSAPKKIEDSK